MIELHPVDISKLTNQEWFDRCKLLTKMADTSRKHYIGRLSVMDDYGINLSKFAMLKAEKAWEILVDLPRSKSLSTAVTFMRAILTVGYIERATRAAFETRYDEWRNFLNAKQIEINKQNYENNLSKVPFTLAEIKQKILDAPPELHYQRMVMGIYTFIPPARLDFVKAKFHVKDPGNLTESNHIIIGGPSPRTVLNKYKTCKVYGQIINEIPIDLLEMIVFSLRKVPREFLFTTKNDNKDQLQNACYAILGIRIGCNDLRRVFASSIDSSKLTNKEFADIARKMGHSSSTSIFKYRKLAARDRDDDESDDA